MLKDHGCPSDFNNKILLQWFTTTYPKVTKDSAASYTTTLPTSYTATTYAFAVSILTDAGSTARLRQFKSTKTTSNITIYWWSEVYTTSGTGKICVITVGF